MKLPPWFDAAAVTGGLLLLAFAMFGMWMGGIRHQQLVDAQRQEKPLVDTIVVRDTLFRHDTTTLRSVRVRHDVALRVDTLWRSDTVRALLGSERAACDNALSACNARVAARDSLNANLRKQIDLLKKQHPSRFSCVVGGAANTKGLGLGGACGLRIF